MTPAVPGLPAAACKVRRGSNQHVPRSRRESGTGKELVATAQAPSRRVSARTARSSPRETAGRRSSKRAAPSPESLPSRGGCREGSPSVVASGRAIARSARFELRRGRAPLSLSTGTIGRYFRPPRRRVPPVLPRANVSKRARRTPNAPIRANVDIVCGAIATRDSSLWSIAVEFREVD